MSLPLVASLWQNLHCSGLAKRGSISISYKGTQAPLSSFSICRCGHGMNGGPGKSRSDCPNIAELCRERLASDTAASYGKQRSQNWEDGSSRPFEDFRRGPSRDWRQPNVTFSCVGFAFLSGNCICTCRPCRPCRLEGLLA